ncbi:hypothetical protein WA588_002188, partial [Blastocystis sp. NMH]
MLGMEEETGSRSQQRKMQHNEAEKKRIRTINKSVDDIRIILDEAKIAHKADKVSTLEAAAAYMKMLLKERDRLISSLGYMGSMLPNNESTNSDDETFPVDEPSPFNQTLQKQHQQSIQEAEQRMHDDPERYRGHSLLQRVINAEGASETEPHEEEMTPPSSSLSQTSPLGSSGIETLDYKRVWMSNNIATVVVHIETGQLLKGNTMFMKLFQFSTAEELNRLSLFDIIVVNDLSLFWSEYSQLVNCNRQIIRSFVVTVTNPSRNISLPCLITMGPIMDYEGYVFQVSVSFTPLKQVNEDDSKAVDSIGKQA